MQVSVSGQHISIGDSLKEYVQTRSHDVIQKYFDQVVSANAHFSKQHANFICELIITGGMGRNTTIKSSARAGDVYASFDIAIAKAEQQLRKYKSKLKDRHDRVKVSAVPESAIKYIISPYQGNEDAEEVEDNPIIIAEKRAEILPLSVSDAVMKMDLENLPALMFRNSKTDRINVVYYRHDGNISWVDSLK